MSKITGKPGAKCLAKIPITFDKKVNPQGIDGWQTHICTQKDKRIVILTAPN